LVTLMTTGTFAAVRVVPQVAPAPTAPAPGVAFADEHPESSPAQHPASSPVQQPATNMARPPIVRTARPPEYPDRGRHPLPSRSTLPAYGRLQVAY
jgi:hypothetical protein